MAKVLEKTMKVAVGLLVVLCISPVICNVILYITSDINHAVCIEHPCLTLSQLASKDDVLSGSNVTLRLISEDHILTTQLLVANINHFVMSSSNGAVIITCQQPGDLMVMSVNSIIISGITFQQCSGIRFMRIANLVLVDLTVYSEGMDSMITLINVLTTIIRSSFIGNATHDHHNIPINNGGALVAVNSTIAIRDSSFGGNSARKGGAIYATHGTKVMVQNSRFFDNIAEYGGALFIEHSNITLDGSTLYNNIAQGNDLMTGNGGAIFVDGQSVVDITNTSITNNTAVSGGGLYTHKCQVFVEHSILSKNRAANSGGALYCCSKKSVLTSNGAMLNTHASDQSYHHYSIFIGNNSRIINNHAYSNGGGLYNYGNFLSLESNQVSNNYANYGGGVYGSNCNMVLNDNTFDLNTAVFGGGAMCLKESHPIEIDNCTFSGNEVKYGRGAAIESYSVLIRLVHCNVNNNTATECGGIEANMIEITDSIFESNSASGQDEVGGGGVLCVWNGYISVEGSVFEQNMAMKDGGVMIINNSSLRMLDSNFINNKAYWIGGIKADDSNITITSCQFCNSTETVEIGVMRANGCSINITGSIFHNNSMLGSTGIMHIRCSEINIISSKFSQNSVQYQNSVLQAQESIVLIENCTFERNAAIGHGMMHITSNSSITISSSHFSDNIATYRGSVFNVEDSVIVIEESTFRNSTSKNRGGVMVVHRSILTVISCYFMNNHAKTYGGVFDIQDASNVTVWTSLFEGNTAGKKGGVMDIDDSTFVAVNCTFDSNNATGSGGVIKAHNSRAAIEDCLFRNNYGLYGGVIHIDQCMCIIEHCLFSNNAAITWGGVANFYMSSSSITNSEFHNNTVVNGGGALHNSRGYVTILDCYFSSNSATAYGGVMDISYSVLILLNSQFKMNEVVNNGGVLHASRSKVLISNCSFINNRALDDGGAIDSWLSSIAVDSSLFLSNVASQDGGAIMIDDSNLTLCGCRLKNNSATHGGGIAVDDSNLTMTNVHLINNKAHYHGGAVDADDSKITMEAALFVNNSAINGGAISLDNEDRVVVITSTFHSNFARDRGGAIAVRWQSTISINDTNIYNNTAKWGTAISNCNGLIELSDLSRAIDSIYTYCTVYEGESDMYTDYSVISNKLDICSNVTVNILSDSLSQIITDTILATHETLTKLSTMTVSPTEDSNLTEGDVSTTMSYGDCSEAATTHLTTIFIEASTVFPDECPSPHSDAVYIVALVIITVICLILLGYVTFNKMSRLMQSQFKRVSCDTEDHEKEGKDIKYTGD